MYKRQVEHHSESPEALYAHTAGLRIITPSNAHDAYWMEQQAIASDDPVIIFEPKRRYWLKGEVDETAEPMDPFSASVIREGEDATVVAWGPLVPVALAAANAAEEDGRSVEVIDLRSISPIDFDSLTASVRKTGRLVIAHEAVSYTHLDVYKRQPWNHVPIRVLCRARSPGTSCWTSAASSRRTRS